MVGSSVDSLPLASSVVVVGVSVVVVGAVVVVVVVVVGSGLVSTWTHSQHLRGLSSCRCRTSF